MSDMTNHIANIINQAVLNNSELKLLNHLNTFQIIFNCIFVVFIILSVISAFLILRKKKKIPTSVYYISIFCVAVLLVTNLWIEHRQNKIANEVIEKTMNRKDLTDFCKSYPYCLSEEKNIAVFVKNKNDINKYKNENVVVNSDNSPILKENDKGKISKLSSVPDGKNFKFQNKEKIYSTQTKDLFEIIINKNLTQQQK